MSRSAAPESFYGIAVVALAGRFPGARNVDELWRNLSAGVESITAFSDQELLAAGVDPALVSRPDYVKVGTVLADADRFDAAFFGYPPREAELMDPQLRVFLECAWEVLETAGYDPQRLAGRSGVFAGMSAATYLLFNRRTNWDRVHAAGTFQTLISNDKDFLPAHVSYKLGLRGPSVNVQSACSTSLVAVHLGCQSLLSRESDLVLAGGVSIGFPDKSGYLAGDEAVASPDGHCRAFDARAQGTVRGNGVGIVVLKRLEDALADGDAIRAVIRGSAINNDGSLKAGFTAPGVEGQAEVIAEALSLAGVGPETIGYLEAHGTATPLGDSIEVAALNRAFRTAAARPAPCAIGSVKTNVGHLDAAAGVTGLIKTVLAVEHGLLPPSLHFAEPNPEIDFAATPFRVPTELCEWPPELQPRRAGVSSFGLGGTNAHVVLEEAPPVKPSGPSRRWQLLLVSARTPAALETATGNLAAHLRRHPEQSLADVAYTCQVGRQRFRHRRMLVCRSGEAAAAALETLHPQQVTSQVHAGGAPAVIFLFPGGGAQYPGMGAELYRREEVFREQIDACARLLEPTLDFDLRALLYPEDEGPVHAELRRPGKALPALFATEYALARLWMDWGIRPRAMIGHSLGEYTAACLAGVLSLEEALSLVTLRGRLFETLPRGSMLSVAMAADALRERLGEDLSIAAINGPGHCVVAGPEEAVAALARELAAAGGDSQPLHIEVAAHSSLVEPVLEPFRRHVASLELRAPRIPYLSNVTGTWITAGEVTDPDYWCRHLRQTVRFSDGLRALLAEPDLVFLEVGPGQTLSTLVRQHLEPGCEQQVLPSLRHLHEETPDDAFLLKTLGRLWLAGAEIDWQGFAGGERRRRVPLPTYPFERRRFRVEPGALRDPRRGLARRPEVADWFYLPAWRPSLAPAPPATGAPQESSGWLVFLDDAGSSPRPLTPQSPLPALPPSLPGEGTPPPTLRTPASDVGWGLAPPLSRSTISDVGWGLAPPLSRSTISGREGGARPHPTSDGEGCLWVGGGVPSPGREGGRAGRGDRGVRGLGGGGSAASLGRPLVRRLEEAGETVFTVRQAEAFARTAPRQYTVGASPRDYELLIADLRARPAGIPRRMVHLGSLAQGPEDASPAELPEAGFYSLLFLARALAQQEPPAPCRLTVVSAQGQSVTGEEALIPANATLPGVCKVITQELPHLICRSIDVVLPAAAGPPWERLAERLLRELRADPPEPVVAYRGDRRLVAGFEPVRIPEPRGTPGLRPRGVYLITGGLGKVGLALAGYLAEAVKARLVLVGRSAFPHRDAWSSWLESHPPDNGISRKIRRLRALEQAGGEVVVERADVADPAQLKAVVARAVDRFGRLHGVVHAAAHTGAGSFATVATATREACELQFRAKVHGLCALEEALGESELDFCMLTSSLAAHLGGLGFAAYAAANRFMDAWAERHNRSHPGPWMSVNWEGWTPEAGEGFTGVGARSTISPQEGVAVFRRLLAVSGEAQVAVSTADLETRLSAARPPADAQESEVESAPADSGDDLHSRYAAPRDPVEQAVAEIWSDLLGLERVGLYDDFFELGGHSLLATRILSRVRETLRVDLPLLEFFREATVEGLSRRVKERLAGGDGDGESSQLPIGAALSREEELLEHLDQVSDETVESLLRELLAREENPG